MPNRQREIEILGPLDIGQGGGDWCQQDWGDSIVAHTSKFEAIKKLVGLDRLLSKICEGIYYYSMVADSTVEEKCYKMVKGGTRGFLISKESTYPSPGASITRFLKILCNWDGHIKVGNLGYFDKGGMANHFLQPRTIIIYSLEVGLWDRAICTYYGSKKVEELFVDQVIRYQDWSI